MNNICTGKVVRDGTTWYCLDCGHSSTSWDMKHTRLQSTTKHFADCFGKLLQLALSG